MISEAASKSQAPLSSLGPVIHNPQTVEKLKEELGIEVVDSIAQVSCGTVVIRTHGVGPEVLTEARAKGLSVLDATCPFVSKIQEHAKTLTRDGYKLFIIGERNHPEVLGIVAHAGGNVTVIESVEDVKSLGNCKRAGIVIQSTQEEDTVREIVRELLPRVSELRVYNTICHATKRRQGETKELARTVDVMVVVGGRNSGNTRRLVDICRATGVATYHIEDDCEILPAWFQGIENVGITAGASTPDSLLESVIRRIGTIGREACQ